MKPRLALAMAISGAVFLAAEIAAEPVPVAAAPAQPSGPIEVNGIAARVNGRVITKNQVAFRLAPVLARLRTQFPRRTAEADAIFKAEKAQIVQELIDCQIILDEFKQLNQVIKPTFIDEEIKRQQRESYNGDEAKFREELKRYRMTMEGYREMTKDTLVVQAMRQQQFSDAPPPLPNEIQNEYNEIKKKYRDISKDVLSFQKIFIPASDPENPSSTPDNQLTLAEGIAQQIRDGKDFTELAKAQSKDAYADVGGVQENVPRPDLTPEFSSIVVDAPLGKVLGPLLDRQGFTIVKPIKIVLGPAPPLEGKLREMIEGLVRRKKTSVQYQRWIEGKRKRAMIDIKE